MITIAIAITLIHKIVITIMIIITEKCVIDYDYNRNRPQACLPVVKVGGSNKKYDYICPGLWASLQLA